MLRRLLAALVAAAALLPSAALAVPQPGKPAPALDLPSLDGKKSVNLQALRGKPVYINFFASWCGPCNSEAPSIRTLREKYDKRGLTFVGVDELDPRGAAAAFVKKYDAPYDLVALDDSGALGRTYGTVAMPVHVFIDRNGIVKQFVLGEMNPAQIEAALRALL